METFSATTIFWLLVSGVTAGWVAAYIIGSEGVTLQANLLWGTIGSLATGGIALLIGLGYVLLFAFLGTLGVLFLANVFHLHHQVDIFGDIDRGIMIRRRKPKKS